MFKRVLVGVDGRAGGRDAIALAQQLVMSSTRLILANGSVSGHLARHSACPLLVMPRVLAARAPQASGETSPGRRVTVG